MVTTENKNRLLFMRMRFSKLLSTSVSSIRSTVAIRCRQLNSEQRSEVNLKRYTMEPEENIRSAFIPGEYSAQTIAMQTQENLKSSNLTSVSDRPKYKLLNTGEFRIDIHNDLLNGKYFVKQFSKNTDKSKNFSN